MIKKPSLYTILGVLETADSAEISTTLAQKMDALESNAAGLDSAALASRKQMVRIAASTLLDPATKLTYDAKLLEEHLQSNAPGNGSPNAGSTASRGDLALSLAPVNDSVRNSVHLRADALALRAEALSLRADAILLQAGAGSGSAANNDNERRGAWLNFVTSGPLLRVLTFLIVLVGVGFGISRCVVNAPVQANAAANQAAERAAIQEYFQSHGVRPANMAELELLETERRRKENAQRSEKQDVDKVKTDEQKFEEESRRRGREVSDQLRRDEEQHKLNMEREQLKDDRLASERKEADRAAEELRIKRLEEQWKQTIKR